MSCKYAKIIVDISHEALDRVFEYGIPENLKEKVNIGCQVVIPFGQGNRTRTGYVLDLCDEPEFDKSKIKDIIDLKVDDSFVEGQLIQLAYWMRKEYGTTMIQALQTVLPIHEVMKEKQSKIVSLVIPKEEATMLLGEYRRKKYVGKARLLEQLIQHEMVEGEQLRNLKITSDSLKKMVAEGIVSIQKERIYRNPYHYEEGQRFVELNEEQKAALDVFCNDRLRGLMRTYLLYGVTGSGKTRVYQHMMEQVLKEGKQIIVLIPEIALTYQTVKRFSDWFGDRVSVLHSKMSKGERFDQFSRAAKGDIQIMVGPRSALFTPFDNIGLIIIDEEHEQSYKSDAVPKYHARDVAIKRAEIAGASLVLGSATPSIESFTKAKLGQYQLLTLTKRVGNAKLPHVEVVDLKQELKNGNRSMFSMTLKEKMKQRLDLKQQIILFINRRGYSNFVSCRQCGYVVKCPHCDVALKIHQGGSMKCHYCGYEERLPNTCPTCGSKYISIFGTGTQKVEAAVKKVFPNARVLRMDADTTTKKGSYENILKQFYNQEADILIGTQMIVKGHDFPNVTLVGAIAADLSLYSQDFRSSERTFQLLTQAAGRAGRGEIPGDVVIQTYSKEHYSLVTAAKQDYEAFYEQEYAYRSIMHYPPVYQMMVLFMVGEEEAKVRDCAQQMKEHLVDARKGAMVILGPSQASIFKMKDRYRMVIYVKHRDYEELVARKEGLEPLVKNWEEKGVRTYFDFNPMNMY